MLHVTDLSFRHGERVLFDRAGAAISDGWKVGLVGRNGAGKSTLLRLIQGQLEPAFYPAFANYLARTVEDFGREGVSVSMVTIQNEPDFEPGDYPGMRVNPSERAIIIGRHVGPAFRARGLKTQILDYDHNWDNPEMPLAVLSDPQARSFIAGVAWHCYEGDVPAQSPVHDAYPDKDAWETECSGGEWSPKFAETLGWMTDKLIIGASNNWSRGSLLWNLALDPQHGPHHGGCGDCRGVVTIDPATGVIARNVEYYVLGHASRFILPGAYRVATARHDNGIEAAAFLNPDGSKVAILHRNSGDGPVTIALDVDNALKPGRFNIQSRMKESPGGSGAGSLVLPSGQRVTLGGKVTTIGRLPDCTVPVNDPNVSRRHTEVRPIGSSFVLVDLGSTNGTKVNGMRINGEHVLDDGDIVSVGATHLRFEAS